MVYEICGYTGDGRLVFGVLRHAWATLPPEEASCLQIWSPAIYPNGFRSFKCFADDKHPSARAYASEAINDGSGDYRKIRSALSRNTLCLGARGPTLRSSM